MADQWLSIVEYARCFNISDMTVRRRIKNGKLHAVLKEGKYYIPIADDTAKHSSRRQRPHEEVGGPEPRDIYNYRWEEEEADEEDYYEAPRQIYNKEAKKSDRSRYPQERHKSHFSQQEEKMPTHLSSSHPVKKFRKNDAKRPQKDNRDFSHLPKEITRSFESQNASVVETEALLDFCNTAMRSLDNSKKVIEESFKNKVEALEEKTKALEAQLGEKDQKVEDLKQKVEDFHLLIKIIESAKKNN
ncbi:MAG: helix-turn-helix domain-containing protein [Oligoflexales bacterium]